jgi:hypothetical protein
MSLVSCGFASEIAVYDEDTGDYGSGADSCGGVGEFADTGDCMGN